MAGFYSVGAPHHFQDGTFYPVMHYASDLTPGQCAHVRDVDMALIHMNYASEGRKLLGPGEWESMLRDRQAEIHRKAREAFERNA